MPETFRKTPSAFGKYHNPMLVFAKIASTVISPFEQQLHNSAI